MSLALKRMKAFARKAGFEGGEKIRTKREMLDFLNREIKKEIEEPKPEPILEPPIHPLSKRWREFQLEQKLRKVRKDLDRERRIRQKLAALRGK